MPLRGRFGWSGARKIGPWENLHQRDLLDARSIHKTGTSQRQTGSGSSRALSPQRWDQWLHSRGRVYMSASTHLTGWLNSSTSDANATLTHESGIHSTRHRRAAASILPQHVRGGFREDGSAHGANRVEASERLDSYQSDALPLVASTAGGLAARSRESVALSRTGGEDRS